MGWLVILAAAAAAIMIYTEARMRLVLLGLLALAAVTAIFFLYFFENMANPTGNGSTGVTSETIEQRKRIGQARAVIAKEEIELSDLSLAPRIEKYFKADGSQGERANLYAWSFAATVKNANPTYAAATMAFTVRLYSCPDYFTTAQDVLESAELTQYCTRIGDRRLAFYNLDLAPGASTNLSSEITFDNQSEPHNWRYLIEMTEVVAKVAN